MSRNLVDPTLDLLAQARPADVLVSETQQIRAEALVERVISTPRRSEAADSASTRATNSLRHRALSRRAVTPTGKLFQSNRHPLLRALTGLAVIAAGLALFFGTAPPAAATLAIRQAAVAAGAQPWDTGQYFYSRDQWIIGPIDGQLGADDPGRVIITFEGGQPVAQFGVGFVSETWVTPEQFLERQDSSPERVDLGMFYQPGGHGDVVGPQPTFGGTGLEYTWDEVMALPTNARELRQRLLGDRVSNMYLSQLSHRQKSAYRLWNSATSLLQHSPASPELRRALWQVLAGIRGVELLDATTDSLGRSAVAVRLDLSEANWYRETLWFNPDDGAVLETELYSPFEAAERQSVRVITLEQGWRDTAPVPNWINGVGPITDNN